MNNMIDGEDKVNELFWQEHPEWEEAKPTVKMGDDRVYKTDIRVAYCDFVENLVRSGQITEELASEITL